MNLDAITIAAIKQEFVARGGEVDIFEFVGIMRAFLPDNNSVSYVCSDEMRAWTACWPTRCSGTDTLCVCVPPSPCRTKTLPNLSLPVVAM